MKTFDRHLGSFRGLAIGDALGAPVEFKARDSFPWVKDFAPSPHFNLKPGQWTDDTIMAIAMASSIIAEKGYDSYSVMGEYLKWYEEGKYSPNGTCFDIGNQTSSALRLYTVEPVVEAKSPKTTSAGNGTLMRLAPVAIVSQKASWTLGDKLAALSAKETHYSDEAIEATVIMNRLLRAIYSGAPKPVILRAIGDPQDTFGLKKELSWATTADRSEVVGSGYVRESLKASWWAFMSTDCFSSAIEAAVNLGVDTDTTAAITGQLAGAYYGDDAIDSKFKKALWQTELFALLTKDLQALQPHILRSRFEGDPEFQKPTLS